MNRDDSRIQYAHRTNPTIPDNVANFGIDLAISAIALPSCCILTSDTVGTLVGINVGANVGINVGADIKEEDIDHYFIV